MKAYPSMPSHAVATQLMGQVMGRSRKLRIFRGKDADTLAWGKCKAETGRIRSAA